MVLGAEFNYKNYLTPARKDQNFVRLSLASVNGIYPNRRNLLCMASGRTVKYLAKEVYPNTVWFFDSKYFSILDGLWIWRKWPRNM